MAEVIDIQQLEQQIMSFRVTELQMLLSFARRNKKGKKTELQAKALELLKEGQLTVSIQNKIRELYKANVSLTSTKMYASPPIQFPVLAHVKFKPLPFYDVLHELLKPATLTSSGFQESTFTFHLTAEQANEVAMSQTEKPDGKIEHVKQIQLRFCLLETSCEQEDNLPPSVCVKVNSKICKLPNLLPTNKPKRPSRPVNITYLCEISPTTSNQISISWASKYGRAYAVAVFLVNKQTSNKLLQKIKSKGIRNSGYTRAMIKGTFTQDPDSELNTTCLKGSLLCPLGKMRIQIPCRATTCTHFQCFDALSYLQMNEKKPEWICPFCGKKAEYSYLAIDGLFTEIINQAPSNCNEVKFHEDGSWAPIVVVKKESCETVNVNSLKRKDRKASKSEDLNSPPESKKHVDIDIITIDSDSEKKNDEIRRSVTNVRTPVLSSGSSSGSDTPNIALPSPDSSSVSSSFSPTQHLNSLQNQNSNQSKGKRKKLRQLRKKLVDIDIITIDSDSEKKNDEIRRSVTNVRTPVLSSGSSSGSDMPNIALPSPDSSSVSSSFPSTQHLNSLQNQNSNQSKGKRKKLRQLRRLLSKKL
ncbi:E3 SUMO-protein ligase PIAS2-like protein [Dinothrombium tinctorium]|uniref:E3 SUMO-protein ligase PIAS2-like protein n=1 Tax=Dinothrombium tinctorium TaxID=1965070 RepID=A0A3S5WGX6_9ACAR|nr:E3 SUMO-protein ligase PIAS2-like protein [Dinothrombium tinctorium]